MPTVAIENFAVCTGCEVAVLDIGEALLDLLPKLDFVHCQVLMDRKWFGSRGEGKELDVAKADVGIITGGIRTEEDRHIAQELRKNVKTLISLGACSVYGGIPALANMSTREELLKTVYSTHTTEAGVIPGVDIPALTDRVYAVDEAVKVDLHIPGCPPNPDNIADAVVALLNGKPWSLPERSVCDDCPTKREKKAQVALKRPLQNPDFKPGAPLSEMRCFNEQGILCNGPATRTGCGGHEKTPRCIAAYMPCRGCMGPIRPGAKPMVDMMGALSSIGLDAKQIEDRMAHFNRYIGGHNNLRVLPKR
ncbi:MAG: methyl viologen-reducing hydrogenase [Thermoplasmatota archaeon]